MATYSAQGTVLARETVESPQTFTTIPQVVTISSVGVERSLKDVTDLSSTIREWDANIPDGKELQCEAWYDPDDAQHTALKTALDDNSVETFRITLSDSPAETHTFSGRVVNWEVSEIEVDGHYRLMFTIKITTTYTIA